MPAKKEKQQPKINLISQKEFEATTGGRILTWALSSFRIIVILTELVVIAAFFSRFWLDSKNSNLDDLIAQKQSNIIASKEFEEEFRDVQNRAEVLSILLENQDISPDLLKTIAQSTPQDMVLSSVRVGKDQIDISGVSAGEKSIQQLIANLSHSSLFSNVILDEIADQAESKLLTFKLRLKTKT